MNLETQNKLSRKQFLKEVRENWNLELKFIDEERKFLKARRLRYERHIMEVDIEMQEIAEWLSEREAESLANGSKIINP